jgi:hypothetical protein
MILFKYKGKFTPGTEKINLTMRHAVEDGDVEVVKLLLNDERVDPGANDNYLIKYACTKTEQDNTLEIVRLLLNDSRVDPSADENFAILFAIYKGSIEIVKLLLLQPKLKESFFNN